MDDMELKHEYDMGDNVMCDSCNQDSYEQGGILFNRSAYCPACTKRMINKIRAYGEEGFITDRARPNESFHDFVIRIRDGHNSIKIYVQRKKDKDR